MNLKPALKLSLDVAPAEAELRRCETLLDLADAWWIHADNMNGARREYLQEVYNAVLIEIERKNAQRANVLKFARTL
jgi:hypothetical protein